MGESRVSYRSARASAKDESKEKERERERETVFLAIRGGRERMRGAV